MVAPARVRIVERRAKKQREFVMRASASRNQFSMTPESNRLETPTMTGYRAGMSSQGVIGRKLGAVYGVQPELPEEMDAALQDLDDRLRDRR